MFFGEKEKKQTDIVHFVTSTIVASTKEDPITKEYILKNISLNMKCEEIDTYQIFIADMSHHPHHRFCPFWPFLAILSRIYALFGALLTGLNSVGEPQN